MVQSKGAEIIDNNTNQVKVANIGVKKVFTLKPILTKDAFDKSVSFVSSDPAVAAVNDKGKVTILNSGEAVIIMTTTDGGFRATCTVTAEYPE